MAVPSPGLLGLYPVEIPDPVLRELVPPVVADAPLFANGEFEGLKDDWLDCLEPEEGLVGSNPMEGEVVPSFAAVSFLLVDPAPLDSRPLVFPKAEFEGLND